MKYLCLVYQEISSEAALRGEAGGTAESDVFDHREELLQSGRVIFSSPLESVRSTTTVWLYNGRVSVTDGPIAEKKEELAGFYVIEARDLNDAIRTAAKMPPARHGCIEIWPLRELCSS